MSNSSIWDADARDMTLRRNAGDETGSSHAIVYDVTDRGTLRARYVSLNAAGTETATLAVVNEYAPATELVFTWPTSSYAARVGSECARFVGARASTGSTDGIADGVHATDRLVYIVAGGVVPDGLAIERDGTLTGTPTVVAPPRAVTLTVHDTITGTTLASHALTLEVGGPAP